MRALNRTSGKELARDLSVAATAFSRAKGLIGRQRLPAGEGLLIKPCRGVHTFLMAFPIDVVFLDQSNRVIGIVEHLKPGRITRCRLSSSGVIELPAGTVLATDTLLGNEIVVD